MAKYYALYNPHSGSCDGEKSARRLDILSLGEVVYQDVKMRKHKDVFTGWTAQIIQHECDHLDGVVI